jgi:primase-polymerase (primpol)-like protein
MLDISTLRTALAGPLAPLAQYRQFMLWRLEPNADGGKPRKIPYRIDGGNGSSTDPSAWVDAATAMEAAERGGMGVAFVLTDNDPFVFIDVDGCVKDGAWDNDAQETFARFPGAAFEVSQSQTGFHMFVVGDVPQGFTGRKGAKFECYRNGRYVALTGMQAQGQVMNFGPNLAAWIGDKFPSRAGDGSLAQLVWTDAPIAEWAGPEDDEELLRQFLAEPVRTNASMAFASLTPGSVPDVPVSNADLFNANAVVLAQAYPSDKSDVFDKSNAAFALALRLAYWTGKNCARIERLMNRAAFRRSKADMYHGDGVTYMRWDVTRACAMTTKVRYQRAAVANAEVVHDAAQAYDAYYDRIAAAPDIHAVRLVTGEIAVDLRIDTTLREVLAGHVQSTLASRGNKLKIDECRKLVAQRSAHPAPDRREMQRQTNIALNINDDVPTLAPALSIAQMLDEYVFIGDGSNVASIFDRSAAFSLPDFRNMMAASRTFTPDNKQIEHSQEWLTHAGRKSVATRTFHAGEPVITFDPAGRTALNLWRPILRSAYAVVDVSPFVDHVRYLFGADAEAFLDWLAHIEQFPGVLPHFGFLHIADHFGTGRNWLESVIARLWRGYVAPSVDMDALITGNFNGVLAGRVIAIVDEIRAGANENAYQMEGKIRNMLTEETRYIKPKFGREYLESNSCRWLLFSNHKNAIPMSDTDRRWYVCHLLNAPREEHVYAHLYGMLEQPAFIDSVGAWLRARDLSAFNPGKRPPVTLAKQKAIDASKSDFQRLAGNIAKYWPCDFITVSDVTSIMFEGDMSGAGRRLSAAMKHALQDMGMHYVDKQINGFHGERFRVWLVRDVEHWLQDLTLVRTAPELGKLATFSKGTGYQTLSALM